MRDEGVSVRAFCMKCRVTLIVDVEMLCAMRGRAFSLIDRTGRCKVVDCGGRTFFMALREGSNVPPMRLTNRSTPG